MNKILFLLFISFIFFSCGEKKISQTPAASAKFKTGDSLITVKDTAPPKDVTLSYQLKKGQHITYQLTDKNITSQTVIADSTRSQKVNQNTTYKIDMDVEDIDGNIMDVKVNVSSIRLDANMNGQKINYQSGSKLDSLDMMRFASFETLINTPFNIRLNPDGEISEFYKVDKIVSKFLDLQKVKKDSITDNVKKQVQFNIVEGALRPLMGQIFRKLPTKRLALDSSWTETYPSQVPPFQLTNFANFKLVDFHKLGEDKLAVIDAGLKVTSKGKNKVSERGVDYNFKNPESTGSGKIYFNLTKGLIQQSKTNTSLKISADLSVPKSPRGPMKAKNTSFTENSYTVELL